MFNLYNGKFPGVATMVNEEAWPAGVTTGLIPWELPFHFFLSRTRSSESSLEVTLVPSLST